MSVVVAIKDGNKIWMGCDSQVTKGWTKATLNSQRKIWKPLDNNKILMGLVGALRDTNILSTGEKYIDELTELKKEVNFKYIVRTVVPKIFSELNNQGRMQTNNGIQRIESEIMFAYKDKCYQIYQDGCVKELDSVLAMGSGEDFSTGAFNVIMNWEVSPKEKLIAMIKSACDSELHVNYPIVIMNTENDEVEIYEKE